MEFTKGNTFRFRFPRRDAFGNIIEQKADNIWFTVKDSYNTDKILIQKTLSSGNIIFGVDKYYHVVIDPKDTNDLDYCVYVYDITVENAGDIYTIKKNAILELTKRVTSNTNIGGDNNE